MISGKIDMVGLQASIKRYSHAFGETNAQAVVRWSVQTCRELAKDTESMGKTAKAKKVQKGAMIKDAYNVLIVGRRLRRKGAGFRVSTDRSTFYASTDKVLQSPSQVNHWIRKHRTRKHKRTVELHPAQRKICSRAVFNKALAIRVKKAGMAKGAWLGAGMRIARKQKGQDRINIGQGYLAYAQRHAKHGKAIHPKAGFKPFAEIINKIAHSGDGYVLSSRKANSAIAWGLKNSISFYRRAINHLDKRL